MGSSNIRFEQREYLLGNRPAPAFSLLAKSGIEIIRDILNV